MHSDTSVLPSPPPVEYAQIDWHDFVIVETISFRESEAGMKCSF